MNKKSRYAWCCVSIMAIFLAITPMLFAQSNSPLEKLPYSGGVLAARAYRAGRLVPTDGGFGIVGSPDLTCSPAPCVFTPVRASPGGQPANENPVAANPTNPMQFLSGANDYNCGNIQGFYATNDGGSTWTRTCTKGSGGEGDPVVGYDLLGNAFSGGIQNSDFVIFTSTDNGTTWSNPIIVTRPLLGSLADKPWMEIDTNANSPFKNAIYISGTQFSASSNSEISVSHSTDAGKTWSTVAVDTQQIFPTSVDQFSDLAVGSDGTVYVTWQRCPANGSAGDCGGTVASMMLSKSTDGGTTWSAPVVVATTHLTPDTSGCFYGCLPNTAERVSNIPSNAATGSGSTAKVFVTFYDYTSGRMQVKLAVSLDGGSTFGTPTVVSTSSSGDQFFPWAALNAGGGRIAITWLDRRNDPANLKYQPFFTYSTNSGNSFGAAHTLSSAQSNPQNDGFGGGFMGDYRTHVWSGKSVYAVWMDSTTGTNNMQDEFGGAVLK